MIRDSAVVRAILDRRSTRAGFTGEPVDRDLLEMIVACGLSAPSSKNAQPWRFHVVSGPENLRVLADAVRSSPNIDSYVPHDPATGRAQPQWVSTVTESAEVLRTVSAAVFVENRGVFGGGRGALLALTPENLAASLVGYGLELLGLGAAIQNMLLAAAAVGVQGVFMGDVLIAEEVIRTHLTIEGDLVGVVALGPSAATPPPRTVHVADPRLVVWH